MRNLLLSCLLLIILLANCFGTDVVSVSGQCQSDQQLLLLQIKNSLIFDSNFSVKLANWSQSTDCCKWRGVDCDVIGRVIGLNLSSESISAGIEKATGLFNLQYLQSLNLAFNWFNATQIPSGFANLTNLTYLNLSNAGFAGQIPIEISTMARLVTLDLSSLTFVGSSLLKLEKPNLSMLVRNFSELRELYLDGVNISANGSEWCQAISSSLPNLQVLSLSSCFLSGPFDSSLANLRSLSVIRLSQNILASPIPDFLADLKNLTSLQLSSCWLSGTFPEKILQVPTLKTFDLSKNKLLQGSLPQFPLNTSLQTLMLHETNFSGTLPDSIGHLKNLSRIELAGCNFTGQISSSMTNLPQLVYLDLSKNHFTGPVPSFHLSKNLSYLDLSNNGLSGGISSTGWEQLLNLLHVDLRFNSLNGGIPPSLLAIPSLEKLQLANNHFEGQVPKSPDASSSQLDTLDLSGNRLEGPIPMSVFELKKLKILLLSSNRFNGTVQVDKISRLSNIHRLDFSYNSLSVNPSSGSSFPPQISTLKLASCNLRVIPNLKNQSKLFVLDLSDNQISGNIPDWIWLVGNGSLTHLNLSHNYFVGLQEPRFISDLALSVLDLHSNQLQGKIPQPPSTASYVDYSSNNFTSISADIGNFLFITVYLSLSDNSLTGDIPESICNAKNLLVLDLSNNGLSGKIPTCLIKMSETLGVLKFRRNSLNGTLSDTFPGNCGLQTLDLNGNQLEGPIPKSLVNCTKLEVLDLGNNRIRDTFPCWLKNVRVLVLRSNEFYGKMDCPEINGSWSMLQIVDLASNNFTGNLPRKFLTTWKAMMVNEVEVQSNLKHLRFEFLGLSRLYYPDSVTVTMKGLEIELVKILTLFTSIDLSCNNFQGPIPEEIGRFKSLHFLNLSHNALTGPIPSSIGNLRQLESLDLSVNNLSGDIPSELAILNFLSVLNLSYNHFVGRIPSSTQLQSFSNTSFEGNEGLCGPPLSKQCRNTSKLQPSAPASISEIDWKFIAMAIGFATGFGAVVTPLMFSKKVNKWYDDRINKFLR